MERIDISDDPRCTAMVEAAERGEEAAVMRDGRVVAELRSVTNKANCHDMAALADARKAAAPLHAGNVDLDAIRAVRAKYGIRVEDAAALIREMRDMDDH